MNIVYAILSTFFSFSSEKAIHDGDKKKEGFRDVGAD